MPSGGWARSARAGRFDRVEAMTVASKGEIPDFSNFELPGEETNEETHEEETGMPGRKTGGAREEQAG